MWNIYTSAKNRNDQVNLYPFSIFKLINYIHDLHIIYTTLIWAIKK